MTPKPRKPGDGGDGGDGTTGNRRPPQRYGDIDAGKGISSAQEATGEAARNGRPGGSGGRPEKPNTPSQSAHTRPSGQPDPNAKPGGTPTDTSTGSPKQREGHRIENDSAVILARAGYKISQNTGEKGVNGTSDPDYNMEGKLWDCYAPSSDKRDNVRSELRDKVKKQAGSIVINMERSPMTVDEMKAILPHVKGLQEVKIIDRNGNIIDAFPQ
jgi:contact-dependent growth inhibition (CDI) system CdiA-like toxin